MIFKRKAGAGGNIKEVSAYAELLHLCSHRNDVNMKSSSSSLFQVVQSAQCTQ